MHRWLMSRNCPAQEATPGRPCFSCHPSCLPVGWQASMSAVSILEGQVKCFSTLAPHYRIIKVLETHTRRSWFHWTEALTLKLFKNILVLLIWIQGGRAQGHVIRSLLDWKLHEEKDRKEALSPWYPAPKCVPGVQESLRVCLWNGRINSSEQQEGGKRVGSLNFRSVLT